MKVYRVELMVIDHDNLGERGVRETLENTRFPNDCLNPSVTRIDGRDIGEWRDDHPLNRRSTADAEFDRLFADPAPTPEGAP
jgi:hypothetical protein